jgi:Zn-finger nucleic acid-binding protein
LSLAVEVVDVSDSTPGLDDCPTCGSEFSTRTVEDVSIDYCAVCGGVWLEHGELETLTGHRGRSYGRPADDPDGAADPAEDGGLLAAVTGALDGEDRPATQEEVLVTCPACETETHKRVGEAVTIDHCPDCGGVWLEYGELEALTGGDHRAYPGPDDGDQSESADDGRDRPPETDADADEDGDDDLVNAVADLLAGRD